MNTLFGMPVYSIPQLIVESDRELTRKEKVFVFFDKVLKWNPCNDFKPFVVRPFKPSDNVLIVNGAVIASPAVIAHLRNIDSV